MCYEVIMVGKKWFIYRNSNLKAIFNAFNRIQFKIVF